MGVHLLYKTLPSSCTEVPNSQRLCPDFSFVLVLFLVLFPVPVLPAMRPPPRVRAPAQDTSRALPAARQTDTSPNSIQQSEQRLCFGIAPPGVNLGQRARGGDSAIAHSALLVVERGGLLPSLSKAPLSLYTYLEPT